MRLLASICILLTVALFACTPEQPGETSNRWVGTITTEGNVTTVVTESGSVWGGTATLVEEASIGVESGAEEYMLGQISSLAADDGHIYVLDRNPPVLRVYDLDATHVRNIGMQGQGPGEFSSPMSVVVMPDGRLVVCDGQNARISFFSSEGTLIEDWPLPGVFGTSRQAFATPDGTLYSHQPVSRNPQTNRPIWGVVPFGPDGEPGEAIPRPEPPDVDALQFPMRTRILADGRRSTFGGGLVPFSPRAVTEFSPGGAILVGTSDRYRLEVRHFDGRVLVMERIIDPVPVSPEEAAWTKRYSTAVWRNPEPSWQWDGPEIPDRKGFFETLGGDPNGRVWVARYGPGIRTEICDENPEPAPPSEITRCWQSPVILDVFGPDGRFLGDVETPRGFGIYDLRRTFISDDLVLASSEDEAGTIMVKRYRLVLPGEQGG